MTEKNLIIGTAGHIDHGKTTLIRALTGSDTDRLQEEKDRGISIDLGFTDFKLDNGVQLGIIDVPGHEKFIKNMLAGAGGVDLALLVIAADEGVMPQTDEHLAILDLLNVKYGIVALTKIDQVQDDWLELVVEDTRDKLSDTFLADAPIVPVSGITNEGIDRLKEEIKKMVDAVPAKGINENVYYPIDRVFTMSGFGTVVTGTLVTGKIKVEDRLMIYPRGLEVRVRSMQVHNEKVETAYPGQRVGINLAGVDKDEVDRGDVLSTPGSLKKTEYIDARLKLIDDLPLVLKHGDRIRFHIGAREVIGRVYLLDREELYPGEDGLVQYRLEEEIVARHRESYVVRRYSPMTTIGGGKVIENNPPRRRKFDSNTIEELKIKESGTPAERVELALKLKLKKPKSIKEIIKETNIAEGQLKEILADLKENERAVSFSEQKEKSWIHICIFNKLTDEVLKTLNNYHERYPLRPGIYKEELRTRLSIQLSNKEFNEFMEAQNQVVIKGPYAALADFKIEYSPHESEVRDKIIAKFLADKFTPPALADLTAELEEDDELIEEIFNALCQSEILIKIDKDMFFHKEALEEARSLLLNFLAENQSIELAEYRDLLDSTRKYVLPLMEYFDEKGITIRKGDKRVLVD